QLLYARRTFSSLLDADEMLLIHLKTEESISLHPFVLLKDCPECKLREIFFFTKFAKDKMHYLSYRTGHLFTTTDYVNDFLDLVGPSLA
ncbi:MAG: hypothetical protein M3539_12670, partial [Acidobacteriota bacterium]|nr:hypothetical protein [Acidobacteriota bacterium]